MEYNIKRILWETDIVKRGREREREGEEGLPPASLLNDERGRHKAGLKMTQRRRRGLWEIK